MEWRPAGWSVCLPLLISPCTIKSRSSLVALAHLGGPGKRAEKQLCVCVFSVEVLSPKWSYSRKKASYTKIVCACYLLCYKSTASYLLVEQWTHRKHSRHQWQWCLAPCTALPRPPEQPTAKVWTRLKWNQPTITPHWVTSYHSAACSKQHHFHLEQLWQILNYVKNSLTGTTISFWWKTDGRLTSVSSI